MSVLIHNPQGSKGYTCCKKRVLDFNDFLSIEGCQQNQHLFTGQKNLDSATVSLGLFFIDVWSFKMLQDTVKPRIDFYQTPTNAIVSIFGKNIDKSKSSVLFDYWEVRLPLYCTMGVIDCSD